MTYLIVGNGPAGISAIEQIRQVDKEGKIILVAAENNQPYSRIMTPEYMTDEVEEKDIYIREDFYERYAVETRLGFKVEQVLPEANSVVLDNGEKINYDCILIATGSRPLIPGWIDTNIEGVFSLWDKADAEEINAFLPKVKKAVIIGAGLVGLQAARALTSKGLKVTIVEMADRLMPTQLDKVASNMLQEAMESQGVEILLENEVQSLVAEDNKIEGVKTKDATLEADLVMVAIGVRPNLEMVEGLDIEKNRGLIANNQMETSIPNIYVAGDIAETPCLIDGDHVLRALWLTAVQQGKVAGANMAGVKEVYYGSHGMNSIQLFGFPIISLGQVFAAEAEEVVLKHPASGAYQKLLVSEGRLVGLLFVGDVQQAGVLYHKLGEPLNKGYWGKQNVRLEENLAV